MIQNTKYVNSVLLSINRQMMHITIGSLHTAESYGFHRGFEYISGANTAKITILMTTPVLNYVEPAQGPLCTSNFTVSFYAPYKYQSPNKGPPKPTDPMVILTDVKSMTVGVISFDGFAEDDVVITKAAELNKLLAKTGFNYDRKNWFFAAYDSPFRVNNRHNEVWIQIEGNHYNNRINDVILDIGNNYHPNKEERHGGVSRSSALMYFCSGSIFTFFLMIAYLLLQHDTSVLLIQ